RLHGLRHHRQVPRAVELSLVREGLLGPRLLDEVERLLEARAALLLGDVVAGIVDGSGAPAHPELQATVAQDVGDGRFLGDLHRVVKGQERHRCPEADARRALGSGGQDHERIGEDREGAAEVELAEPRGVETDGVAELDLGDEIEVSPALGVRAGARQLIEEPEAHDPSPAAVYRAARRRYRRPRYYTPGRVSRESTPRSLDLDRGFSRAQDRRRNA